MKKRILLVTDVYNWGGHVRAEYIKKHLSDEYNFDIMDGEEFSQYTLGNDISAFTQKNLDEFKSQSFDKEVFNLNDFKEFLKNKKTKIEYDLIYILFHTMLLRKDIRRLLRKGKKIISIVTAYPTLRASFIHGGMQAAEKRFLDEANLCVAMLANNNMSLEDLRSIYKGKTYYAPRGVDEKIFYPTRDFIQKEEKDFTVAFVGKANSDKGLNEIIIPACQEAGVKLLHNDRNYTNALGPHQMRDFYNKADAYIVASLMDGTPNPALEAAACGLPIVANHIGNMPEFIDNHKNGWLVERRDIHAYTHRLNWMKRNQRKAWEIGQKGRQDILNNWTWDAVINKHERKIFKEII